MGTPVQRVVLLGFMACGKSTVGRLLAARLGWRHVDLDREIERQEGRSIAEIFGRDGEAHFRRREAELTRRFARARHTVLSPGGGWVTNPSLFELLPPDTLSVWLRVSPPEVLRRLRADPATPERPLLRGEHPAAAIRRLLGEREALYGRAAVRIDTDGRAPADIVSELETIVRSRPAAPA